MKVVSPKALKKRVFKEKIYDLHVKEFMLGQTGKFIDKDKIVLDIGASVGLYTNYFAQHARVVYAFEPVPYCYNELNKVLKKQSNIFTFNIALSDHSGVEPFYLDPNRLSNNSLLNLMNGPKIFVEVRRLDSFAFQDIGFIKIDTEGTELDVLIGGFETIHKYKPTCMVEIYPKFSKYSTDEVFKFFKDLNYNCFYNVRGKGLKQIESVERGIKIAEDPKMLNIHDGDFLFWPSS